MKNDIDFYVADKVQLVVVNEWDTDFLSKTWNVYLLNLRNDTIETVLIVSRGNSDDKKTSTLRHGLGNMMPQTKSKVEMLPEELFGFTNEYLLTFFAEGKLYERRFVFEANSITEAALVEIPLMEIEGIFAK